MARVREGGIENDPLRLGRRDRARQAALLPRAGPAVPHRVRRHRRTAATTSTRCGAISTATSAATCCASTTRTRRARDTSTRRAWPAKARYHPLRPTAISTRGRKRMTPTAGFTTLPIAGLLDGSAVRAQSARPGGQRHRVAVVALVLRRGGDLRRRHGARGLRALGRARATRVDDARRVHRRRRHRVSRSWC